MGAGTARHQARPGRRAARGVANTEPSTFWVAARSDIHAPWPWVARRPAPGPPLHAAAARASARLCAGDAARAGDWDRRHDHRGQRRQWRPAASTGSARPIHARSRVQRPLLEHVSPRPARIRRGVVDARWDRGVSRESSQCAPWQRRAQSAAGQLRHRQLLRRPRCLRAAWPDISVTGRAHTGHLARRRPQLPRLAARLRRQTGCRGSHAFRQRPRLHRRRRDAEILHRRVWTDCGRSVAAGDDASGAVAGCADVRGPGGVLRTGGGAAASRRESGACAGGGRRALCDVARRSGWRGDRTGQPSPVRTALSRARALEPGGGVPRDPRGAGGQPARHHVPEPREPDGGQQQRQDA